MRNDTPGPAAGGMLVVEADAGVDERRRVPTSGGLVRPALIAATGAMLLLAGGGAAREFLSGAALPPWVHLAMYVIAVGGAVCGMLIAAAASRQIASSRQTAASLPSAVDGRGAPEVGGVLPARATDAANVTTLQRLQVDAPGGRRIVPADSVEWFEAQGNYARLHRVSDTFLYRMSLARLEQELDATRFLRVHRSVIVNLDAVRSIDSLPSGDAELVLASGARVRLSRRYAKTFNERTGRRQQPTTAPSGREEDG